MSQPSPSQPILAYDRDKKTSEICAWIWLVASALPLIAVALFNVRGNLVELFIRMTDLLAPVLPRKLAALLSALMYLGIPCSLGATFAWISRRGFHRQASATSRVGYYFAWTSIIFQVGAPIGLLIVLMVLA